MGPKHGKALEMSTCSELVVFAQSEKKGRIKKEFKGQMSEVQMEHKLASEHLLLP